MEIQYPHQILGAQTEREQGFRFKADLTIKGTTVEPLDNQNDKELLLDRLDDNHNIAMTVAEVIGE